MDSPKKSGSRDAEAGYRLERIYVASQSYRLVTDQQLVNEDPSDRNVNFGWDWRPLGPRRFEIIVLLTCEPTAQAPEEAQVRLIGVFEADERVPSVTFPAFIRFNGPAILFPYVREVVSTMTGRGPHGAFHIRPINVVALAEEFDIEKTTGAKYLAENPAVAQSFGLDFRADAPPVSA